MKDLKVKSKNLATGAKAYGSGIIIGCFLVPSSLRFNSMTLSKLLTPPSLSFFHMKNVANTTSYIGFGSLK